MICLKLWNHTKLHTSQTCEYHLLRIEQLWNHTKLHTSQTDDSLLFIYMVALEPYKITHLSNTIIF